MGVEVGGRIELFRVARWGSAFQQLQTYKAEIPALFATNAVLVVSDGVEARAGTLTAGREWFKPWRTIAATRWPTPTCRSKSQHLGLTESI